MAALVVAEHDNSALKPATRNAIAAAKEIAGQEVDILVAGKDCRTVAEAASGIGGVRKVLLAEADAYDHGLAENLAPLLVKLAPGYAHLLAPATTSGPIPSPRINVTRVAIATVYYGHDDDGARGKTDRSDRRTRRARRRGLAPVRLSDPPGGSQLA